MRQESKNTKRRLKGLGKHGSIKEYQILKMAKNYHSERKEDQKTLRL